jgi:hypothetical protein
MLLVVLVVCSFVAVCGNDCSQFMSYENSSYPYIYSLSVNPVNFTSAIAACSSLHPQATLAIFRGERNTQEFIYKNAVLKRHAWIGMSCDSSAIPFWIDGVSLTERPAFWWNLTYKGVQPTNCTGKSSSPNFTGACVYMGLAVI